MSIKKNLGYSFLYQMLILLLPLITAPYATRVLGAYNLGLVSLSQTIAQYFLLFSMLGVNNYGNRSIARVRDNDKDLRNTFWEIYSIQIVLSALCFILYVVYCLIFAKEFTKIYVIQSFYVLSGMIDVNWCCSGLERFKLSTICSAIIRLSATIGIFVFVKSTEDIYIYGLIIALQFFCSNIAILPFVLKRVGFVRPKFADIRKHIKPDLKLFLPVIAISIYNMMDKLLIGVFSTSEEVAFYTYSERIVTIPTTIILATDNVVMPRMSNLFAHDRLDETRRLMDGVMLFAMFMASAMCFGLAAISNIFAPWFYGPEFVKCGYYIMLLSPTIIFKGWAGALRTQYIIPTGKDKTYIVSIVSGAMVNLFLDILLIPFLEAVGAIIGTIAAELTVAAIQFFLCRKEIPIKHYFTNGFAFCIIGIAMFCCVHLISKVGIRPLGVLILQVVSGSLIYVGLSIIYMKVTHQNVLIDEIRKTINISTFFRRGD